MSAPTFHVGLKLAWLDQVAGDLGSSDFQFRIAFAISRRVNKATGETADLSQLSIAAFIGGTEPGVRKGVRALQERGHLEIRRNGWGRGIVACYRPILKNRNGKPSDDDAQGGEKPLPRNGIDEAKPLPRNGIDEAKPLPRNGIDEAKPLPRNGIDEAKPLPGNGIDEAKPLPGNGIDEAKPLPGNGIDEAKPLPGNGIDEAKPLPGNGIDEAKPLPGNGIDEAKKPERRSEKTSTVIALLPYKNPIKNPCAGARAEETDQCSDPLQVSWQAIKKKLEATLGADKVRAWLDPLKAEKIDEAIVLSAPTKFLASYNSMHHSDLLLSAWRSVQPSLKRLRFHVRGQRWPRAADGSPSTAINGQAAMDALDGHEGQAPSSTSDVGATEKTRLVSAAASGGS
jgi:hypothetical protein